MGILKKRENNATEGATGTSKKSKGKWGNLLPPSVLFGVVALALEVMSTVWAFEEARAAGSLDGNVQCDADSVLEAFHRSNVTQENCEELDPLLLGSSTEDSLLLYDYVRVGCGDPTVPSTEEASFLDHCGCDDPEPYSTTENTHVEGCSWIGAEFTDIPELSGYCFAVAISHVSFGDDESEDDLEYRNPFERDACWPNVASGTATITIFAFVMTLVTHVAEGFVVRQKVKYPDKGPSLRVEIGASVVEAVGVVAIFWVLSNFTSYQDNSYQDTAVVLEGLALFAVACAVLGLLAEVLAGYGKLKPGEIKVFGHMLPQRDRSSKPVVQCLGEFGSATIWLGSGLLEVVVTIWLVWRGEGIIRSYSYSSYADSGEGDLSATLSSQVALEVLALLAQWAAKYFWATKKVRMQVDQVEGPVPIPGGSF